MYNIRNINSILKRKYNSNVVKNGLWLYVLQLFNTVIPIISLPYITRVLGSATYGIFSFSLNIIEYFSVVVEYGFNFSGTRKIALSTNEKEISHTFVTILYAKLFLLFICFIGLNVFLFVYKMDVTQKVCCYILFMAPLGVALQQTWLFQGLQKMHYITIISVISRTISLLLIFRLVHTADDLMIYCLLHSATSILIGIFGVFISIRLLVSLSWKVNIYDIWNELKTGWYTFTTSLSSRIFSAVGVTILGVVSTNEHVGIYSAIHKIPTILLLLWSPISQVLYPVSSQKMKAGFRSGRRYIQKLQKYFSVFFGFISIFLCLLSRPIVYIAFGAEYAEYSYVLIPLVIWINLGIWNNFLGIQTLLGGGYDNIYSKCFQISVVVTVVLNVVLIKVWDIAGAALAPMLSELVLHILLHYQVNKLWSQAV